MDAKQCDVNFFTATLTRNNYSPSEIHRLLVKSWGEENTISLRRVQQIAKEYKEEERTHFQRKQGSGRPRTSTGEENVTIIREMIEEDCHLSCPKIARVVGIEETSVRRILKIQLGKKSLCNRWIPHILSDDNKENRVICSQEMLNVFSTRRAKEKIIVIDEKWICLRDVPPKECNRVWVDGAGDRPAVARRTISDRKILIIVASNYTKSLTYFELLQDGGSVNADRYLQFLKNMIAQFHGRLPAWEMTIQHDNARPHVAQLVRNWLENHHVTLLKQPPYSPDTNLMDRYIFRNYECYRRGINFADAEEVRHNFRAYLDSTSEAKLSDEFETFKNHLQKIIEANGCYV